MQGNHCLSCNQVFLGRWQPGEPCPLCGAKDSKDSKDAEIVIEAQGDASANPDLHRGFKEFKAITVAFWASYLLFFLLHVVERQHLPADFDDLMQRMYIRGLVDLLIVASAAMAIFPSLRVMKALNWSSGQKAGVVFLLLIPLVHVITVFVLTMKFHRRTSTNSR